MNYTFSHETNPKAEDIEILNDGLLREHTIKMNLKPLEFFAFFIRDENNKVVGGCAGDIMHGGLYVASLWISNELRNKGYGTQLMQRAEELAIKRDSHFMTVNTFNWEALDFYRKLGFYVEFERKGYHKDSIFCFLRKDFIKKNAAE